MWHRFSWSPTGFGIVAAPFLPWTGNVELLMSMNAGGTKRLGGAVHEAPARGSVTRP